MNQKQQGQKQEEKKDLTLNSVEVEDKGLRFRWKRTLDVKLYTIAFLIMGKLQHSQKLY